MRSAALPGRAASTTAACTRRTSRRSTPLSQAIRRSASASASTCTCSTMLLQLLLGHRRVGVLAAHRAVRGGALDQLAGDADHRRCRLHARHLARLTEGAGAVGDDRIDVAHRARLHVGQPLALPPGAPNRSDQAPLLVRRDFDHQRLGELGADVERHERRRTGSRASTDPGQSFDEAPQPLLHRQLFSIRWSASSARRAPSRSAWSRPARSFATGLRKLRAATAAAPDHRRHLAHDRGGIEPLVDEVAAGSDQDRRPSALAGDHRHEASRGCAQLVCQDSQRGAIGIG